jgi:hypothetical protein
MAQDFKPLTNAGEIISIKQEVNQFDAKSFIETQSCPLEKSKVASQIEEKFATYFCIAWRAPYMTATFLFRPIVFIDVTSTASLFAALENIFWSLIFLANLFFAIRKRISLRQGLSPAVIFFTLFVLSAGAYQGNMGTGFRHKSLILWLALLILHAVAWRGEEYFKEHSENNSGESAV